MTPAEIRAMILSGDIAPPFTVHTYSGKSYEVTDVANIWTPPAFPRTVAIAVPRKTIAVIRLDAISEVTCEEHEAAATAGK